MSNGMILTNSGRELLALAMAGKELHFTRGAVGDGQAPADPKELKALVSERKNLPIQSMRTSSAGTCECVLTVSNEGQSGGFWLREYGLFARHPDTGQELLYSYCNKGNEAGYLEGFDGSNPINFTLTLITIIDQAANITATISTQNNYVTVSRLESRVHDLFTDSKDIAGVWTYGQDSQGRLSPKSWIDFKLALLGVSDIESMNSRLERIEDNVAELLLKLEDQKITPGYSHYIVEDFKTPDQVDMFACKITSIITGDDSIDCDPIAGIAHGGSYTITDGLKVESVQVHSVNIENGIQRIILESPIKNSYNIETCRMYRTSADISDSGAAGAGIRKFISWRPDTVWKGEITNAIQTATLDTSAGNAQAYRLSEHCTITSTGALTLIA